MSNNDSFIDEVTEEVRRDRLFAFFRRYGWIGVLAILAIVGTAAFFEYRRSVAEAEAQAFGDSLLRALEAPDAAARAEALAAVEATGTPEAAALLGLLRAGAAAEAGEDDAAERLWALADRADLPPIWRDLAAIRAAMASSGTMDPEERIARLEQFALPGAPYRLLALEQIAIADLERGDREAALEALGEILAADAAGEGLRQRAVQLIVALGGDLDAA